MLSELLVRVGFVRRMQYEKAMGDLQKTRARLEKSNTECNALREELRIARERVDQAGKALKETQRQSRDSGEVQRLKVEFERKRKELTSKFESDERHRHEVDKKRQAEFEELKERLERAERDVLISRENLMAVEVKLDILEGAANVLDRRTRDVLAEQKVETTTQV